jgi:glycosyltransferase involved in cell wall biosynthesis
MKIAQIVSTFSPHFGGMGMVSEEEADGLAEHGQDVTVFTLRYPGVNYPANLFLFDIERLSPLLKIGDAGVVPQLTMRLRDFDIVHLHYPFYGGASCAWLAKKLYGKKYILTYHMTASPAGWLKKTLQKIYDFIWQKRILLGAEKILVVDKKYWASLPFVAEIPENKVIEFSNGINLKTFCQCSVDWKEIGLQDWQDKKIILFVGNLLPLKRVDLLLRALAQIKSDDWRLVVVGGGYAEADYKKLVRILGLTDKVRFVGYCVDRDKLAEYYNAAWTTVLPTDNESFSLVAVESLACGTPVILSSNSGGANRIKAGENGWLFAPGSEEDLRKVLAEALSLSVEDRRVWGNSGRRSVVEYDWEKHIEKLEKIYATI